MTREEAALEAACCAFMRARGEDPQAMHIILVADRHYHVTLPAWRTIVAPMRAALRAFLEPRCSYRTEDETAWAICGWLAEITPDDPSAVRREAGR